MRLFMSGALCLGGILAFIEAWKAASRAGRAGLHNAIGQNFQPRPHTVHHIDFARSTVTVCGDGCVEMSCAFEGCEHRVIMGRDLAESYIEESWHGTH